VQRLLEALKHDDLVSLRKLLDAGIDPNQDVLVGEEYDIDDPDEVPLLFYAIGNNVSIDAISMLAEAGMDITYKTREGIGAVDIAIKSHREDVLRLCIDRGMDITSSSRRSGMTPVILAASFGDIDMVKFLLENGSSLSERDKNGFGAMDYAIRLGHKKMVEFLEKQETS